MAQQVQRVQVVVHIAIGRIDHGGAAIEDVVAAKEQAVFFEHEADMIGRMAGRVQGAQGVLVFALSQHQALAVGQCPIGREFAGRARGGQGGQAQDGRGALAQGL